MFCQRLFGGRARAACNKGVIATSSKYPVVMIRTDPPGFEKVLAKYGRGVC